jgi:hypothetical protein
MTSERVSEKKESREQRKRKKGDTKPKRQEHATMYIY